MDIIFFKEDKNTFLDRRSISLPLIEVPFFVAFVLVFDRAILSCNANSPRGDVGGDVGDDLGDRRLGELIGYGLGEPSSESEALGLSMMCL